MRVRSLPSGRVDVLIAEDDAPMRFALRRLLEQKGYRCAEAETGRQAVDLALSLPPQCVLLDLAIPELDGFSVARQLRSDPRTARAHIHCVTGLVDDQTRERAHQAGCEQFLTKPLDPSQLLAVVGQQVRRTETVAVSELTARQAEDLMDWLENQGCTDLEVTLDEETFTVRCDCPPGLRLGQQDDGEVHLFRIERGGLAF